MSITVSPVSFAPLYKEGVRHETTRHMCTKNRQESKEYGTFWGAGLFQGLGQKNHIVEHFLYEKDTVFISAQSGVGKSIFSLQLMASLTTGEAFLGSFKVARPCKVLYVQTEGDRAETMERIRLMERGVRFDHNNWVHLNVDGVCLNTEVGYESFIAQAQMPGINYDVIIIDPLYTTVKGSISQDDVATDWIRAARKMRSLFGCAFLINHHESIKENWQGGKKISKGAKDIMGSTYWGAFANYNFKFSVDKNGLYELSVGKERNRNVIDKINLRLEEPSPLMFVLSDSNTDSEMRILNLLKDSSKPLSVKVIMERAQVSRATCYRAFASLLDQGVITREGSKSSVKYSYNTQVKEEVAG